MIICIALFPYIGFRSKTPLYYVALYIHWQKQQFMPQQKAP